MLTLLELSRGKKVRRVAKTRWPTKDESVWLAEPKSAALGFPQAEGRIEADVAIIGAGISGLTCAFRLLQNGLDVRLFEASDYPGGMIASEWCDGFLLESGPNSCRRTPDVEELEGGQVTV